MNPFWGLDIASRCWQFGVRQLTPVHVLSGMAAIAEPRKLRACERSHEGVVAQGQGGALGEDDVGLGLALVGAGGD